MAKTSIKSVVEPFKCLCKRPDCFGTCNESTIIKLNAFLSNNTYVPIEIGKIIDDGFDDRLTVIGNQFYKKDMVSHENGGMTRIMKKNHTLELSLDESPLIIKQAVLIKMLKEFGEQKNYDLPSCDLIGGNPLDINKLIADVSAIYNRKSALLMYSSMDSINVHVAGVLEPDMPIDNKVAFRSATVSSTKWYADPESKKLIGEIFFQVDGDKSRTFKVNVNRFGSLYRDKRFNWDSSTPKDIVKVSDYGYIQPIHIIGANNEEIAIDNYGLYRVCKDVYKQIGVWSGNKLTNVSLIKDTKIISKINNGLEIMAVYRKYMAPYKLGVANQIVLK